MRAESGDTRPRSGPVRRLLAGIALVGVALASVVFLLVLLEVGFRIAGYAPIYEVYSKPSIFWRYDELLGWSHVPGAEDVYVGPRPWPVEFRSPVKINSIGLRGPEIADLPPDGYRILLLGDSLVAGFEVAYDKTFGALLEKKLNEGFDFPIQVVNTGVRGYGTDQEYLWYQERGRLLRPDLVVAFMSLNDAEDNVTLHRMRRPFGKPAFSLHEDGSLEFRGQPIPVYPACAEVTLDSRFEPSRIDAPGQRLLCVLEMNLTDRSAFFTWVTMRIRRSPRLLRWLYDFISPGQIVGLGSFLDVPTAAAEEAAPQAVGPAYELTTELLCALASSVRESGAGFRLVVPRSERQRLDVKALESDGIDPIIGEVVGHSQEEGRYFYFRNDSHLNETGHAMLARALVGWLTPVVRAARPAPVAQPESGAPAG